jgi:O-antigen ligase
MSATPHDIAPQPRTRRRLVLPFLDSDPLFDLWWLLLLLPLWWWLGIEQFLWPIILIISLIKVIYLQQYKIVVLPPLKWFGLFVVAILVSSLFIIENYRWVTFIRNFGAYISGFLILLIITNRIRSWRSVSLLLNAMLIAMVIAGSLGVLAMLGIWRPTIESLTGKLLPESISSTSYGQLIAVRSLGQRSWFIGLEEYFRLNSFFLFATHFASAIVYVIPFFFFKLTNGSAIQKGLAGLTITLLLTNLVFTTGRIAAASLIIGGIYFIIFQSYYRRPIRFLSAIGLLILLLILALTGITELASPGQPGVITQGVESLETFIFARGAGSYNSRSAVYMASIQGFLQRPLFGWGTERDVVGIAYPAGSHSEYIAILYRQGIVGVVLFAGLIWSSWRATRPPTGHRAKTPEGSFLRYGRWFFVTALINNIAADPAIDTTVYIILWLGISLLVATRRLITQHPNHVRSTR